jgi:hypothetical protein
VWCRDKLWLAAQACGVTEADALERCDVRRTQASDMRRGWAESRYVLHVDGAHVGDAVVEWEGYTARARWEPQPRIGPLKIA